MYESLTDITNVPSNPPVPSANISFTDLSTSSDPTSSISQPIGADVKKPVQKADKVPTGFKPTTMDTGKDTQYLVESDTDD